MLYFSQRDATSGSTTVLICYLGCIIVITVYDSGAHLNFALFPCFSQHQFLGCELLEVDNNGPWWGFRSGFLCQRPYFQIHVLAPFLQSLTICV